MLSHIAIRRLFKFHLFLNKLRFIYDISLTLKTIHIEGKKLFISNFPTMDIEFILKVLFGLCFGSNLKLVKLSEVSNTSPGIQLVLNYQNGDTSIYTNGSKWFDNTDVVAHQNQEKLSQSNGKLQMSSTGPISIEGSDVIGDYVGIAIDWSRSIDPVSPQIRKRSFLTTQARCYGNDVITFSQIFDLGLTNTSLGLDTDSVNKVSF